MFQTYFITVSGLPSFCKIYFIPCSTEYSLKTKCTYTGAHRFALFILERNRHNSELYLFGATKFISVFVIVDLLLRCNDVVFLFKE